MILLVRNFKTHLKKTCLVLFVRFVVLRPRQQLWSCQDSQLFLQHCSWFVLKCLMFNQRRDDEIDLHLPKIELFISDICEKDGN